MAVDGATGVTGGQPRPPRVALIASSFHPYTGGVEEHVRHVAIELRHAGVPVEVWTVDRGEGLGVQQVDGVTVRYLPTPLPARTMGGLSGFARATPAAALAWRRAYRSFRPDVLNVQCFGPNGVYALGLHKLTGRPIVVTSHGETFADDHGLYDDSALMRASLRRALAAARSVTAPAEFVLVDLRSRFGLVGGEIVPNGIDLPGPEPEPLDLPVGSPMIVAVGRVERMKGFDLLIDAASDLRLARAHVVIGGDGSQIDALRDQARDRGVSDRVHFLGRLSPGQVVTAMSSADVVAVPSRREAFGIVALEAWRAGAPLVGTVNGGMPEFVTDGTDGLLVDPIQPGQLDAALAAVLGDPDVAAALAGGGTQRVRDFAWSEIAGRYRAIYRQEARHD